MATLVFVEAIKEHMFCGWLKQLVAIELPRETICKTGFSDTYRPFNSDVTWKVLSVHLCETICACQHLTLNHLPLVSTVKMHLLSIVQSRNKQDEARKRESSIRFRSNAKMRQLMVKTPLLFLCALLLFAQGSARSDAPETLSEPHRTVDQVMRDIIGLIRKTQGQQEVDLPRFKQEVYELLNPRLDWVGFSRGVMGKHYAGATEAQRVEFVQSVRTMLLEFYAAPMLRLQDQTMRVLPPSGPPSNPNRVNVDLEFVGSDGQAIPIVFYMRRTQGDETWRLVNINLSGINLGLTWRNQFGRIMDMTGDLDQAIIDFAKAVEEASP